MKATAASTAMIHQRFASPSSDASADTSLPPTAVLGCAVSAIALSLFGLPRSAGNVPPMRRNGPFDTMILILVR